MPPTKINLTNIDNLKELYTKKDFKKALEIADSIIEDSPQCDEAWFIRGKIYWRLGHTAEALRNYAEAVAINKTSPAAQALRQANDILDFYNKDLYNP